MIFNLHALFIHVDIITRCRNIQRVESEFVTGSQISLSKCSQAMFQLPASSDEMAGCGPEALCSSEMDEEWS